VLDSQALEAEPPLAEEGEGAREVPPKIGMNVTLAINPYKVTEEPLLHISEREFAELVQLLEDVEGDG